MISSLKNLFFSSNNISEVYTYVFGKIKVSCIYCVEYGVFGKFRFMTQSAYDALVWGFNKK